MVVAVIAVLAALLVPGIERAKMGGERTVALENLRQVGLAIQSYTTEHNYVLPGPLWGGQNASYKMSDTNLGGTTKLGAALWTYLDLPEPAAAEHEAPILGNPAYFRKRQKFDCPAWAMKDSVKFEDNTFKNPWGYPNDSLPSTIFATTQVAGLSKTEMMRDIDKTSPGVAGKGWFNSLPPKPLFGNQRVVMYFDLSVRSEPIP